MVKAKVMPEASTRVSLPSTLIVQMLFSIVRDPCPDVRRELLQAIKPYLNDEIKNRIREIVKVINDL